MAPIKVAFYGCGGIAGYHQGNLKEVPGVSIIGGFDLSEQSMATFQANLAEADQAGFKVVKSPAELLALKPDAVYVCTPPFARGEFELAAAKQKIHLFLEKPIALSMEVANKIAAAIRENGVLMSSGYSLRYNTVFCQLAAALKGRKVSLAHVIRWNKLIQTPWWGDRAKSGGQLTEMTTHQMDFLLGVLGDAADVYGMEHNASRGDKVTIPDVQAGLIRFASGAIATVTTSNALHGKISKNDMEFICGDTLITFVGGEIKSDPEVKLPEPQTHPTIDAAFIQAIREKSATPILSTLEGALKALDLTLRISDMGAAVDRRTEIGMMSDCIEAKTWEERYKITHELGLDFIEVVLSAKENDLLSSGQGEAVIAEHVALANKYDLPVRSFVWLGYRDFDLAWAKDKTACVQSLKPVLEFLKRTGGDVVLLPHRFSEARPGVEGVIVEALRAWSDLAQPYGIKLCVEQIPSSKVQPLSADVAAVVRQVGRANVQVYYDIANPIYGGEDVVQAARNLAPYTGQAHMKGYRQERPLTQLPVREVRRLLVAAGFTGRLALEDGGGPGNQVIKDDLHCLRAAGF